MKRILVMFGLASLMAPAASAGQAAEWQIANAEVQADGQFTTGNCGDGIDFTILTGPGNQIVTRKGGSETRGTWNETTGVAQLTGGQGGSDKKTLIFDGTTTVQGTYSSPGCKGDFVVTTTAPVLVKAEPAAPTQTPKDDGGGVPWPAIAVAGAAAAGVGAAMIRRGRGRGRGRGHGRRGGRRRLPAAPTPSAGQSTGQPAAPSATPLAAQPTSPVVAQPAAPSTTPPAATTASPTAPMDVDERDNKFERRPGNVPRKCEDCSYVALTAEFDWDHSPTKQSDYRCPRCGGAAYVAEVGDILFPESQPSGGSVQEPAAPVQQPPAPNPRQGG